MSNYKINHADIKEWARDYDGEPFDAILCDPPYELGFMGKSWDSSGIAFDKDMWADLFRHIKPGGHLLAFSGSRTYHRMAVAIEDAGFEIRDMIEWVYGSGFPKSLNIGKAVDKIQGNEREVAPNPLAKQQTASKPGTIHGQRGANTHITKGTSPYEGYGTALKPAHEPCVLARKPLEKGMTVATNALKHGTGGLNIDSSRIEATSEKDLKEIRSERPSKTSNANDYSLNHGGLEGMDRSDRQHVTGRFPANLIHDGSDEVVGLFPDSKSGACKNHTGSGRGKVGINSFTESRGGKVVSRYVGEGSAARFFYCAKSSKSERNLGLEGFEEQFAPKGNNEGRDMDNPKNHMGGMQGSKMQNFHPTVKPLSLTKYLANLIKPPTGGRLLVPFSGSGSEMIGGLQAGWGYVEGVELTEEYIPIAEARIKYWTKEPEQRRLV